MKVNCRCAWRRTNPYDDDPDFSLEPCEEHSKWLSDRINTIKSIWNLDLVNLKKELEENKARADKFELLAYRNGYLTSKS